MGHSRKVHEYNNIQTQIKCGFVSHVFSVINLYTSVDIWTTQFVVQLAFVGVSAKVVREHFKKNCSYNNVKWI